MLEGMLRRLKRNNLVLMKHDKKNELSTTYEPQLYKVKDKKGNQVVVSNNNNPARVLRRNTAEVKQYHSTYKQPNNTKAKKKDVTPTLVRKDTAVDPGSTDFHMEGASRRYLQRNPKAPDRMNL